MSNVSYTRIEVTYSTTAWDKVSDCLLGQEKIKEGKQRYLPKPNPTDASKQNNAAYEAYLERAVFYNVTGRTLDGLTGQVFTREPNVEVPSDLDNVIADAEGDGVSLQQQSKRALEYVLSFGRAGLLTDYPSTVNDDGEEVPTSKKQLADGEVRPIIKLYRPEDIINWRTVTLGSKIKLAMLVLVEHAEIQDDENFEIKQVKQYRVLRLKDGVYTVQIYVDKSEAADNSGGAVFSGGEIITPKDSAGNPFDTIPFTFIGVDNNDHSVDKAPLLDLADINIAHFRNSADYEQSCYIVGQPTPWASGITKQWLTDVWKDKAIEFGSRAFLTLPKDGQAGLIQAEPNTMVFEAMQHKERQMVAIGAKIVQENAVQRTATEAVQEEVAEMSMLSSATKNVSTAYTFALEYAALFVGKETEVVFELNSDFDLSKMQPDEQRAVIEAWHSEIISFTEARTRFKRGGIAFQDDKEMLGEVEKNPPINTLEERNLSVVEENAVVDADESNKKSDEED